MAINLTTYFTRMGRIFHAIKSANIIIGGTDISGATGAPRAIGAGIDRIQSQFTTTDQNLVDGLYEIRDNARGNLDQYKQDLADLAKAVHAEMLEDGEIVNDTSDAGFMQALIDAMIGAGTLYNADDDVDAPTATTVTVTPGSTNVGTGAFVASVVRADGRNNELVIAETLRATCTSDGQTNDSARSESFTVLGEASDDNLLAFDYPKGSGANASRRSRASA